MSVLIWGQNFCDYSSGKTAAPSIRPKFQPPLAAVFFEIFSKKNFWVGFRPIQVTNDWLQVSCQHKAESNSWYEMKYPVYIGWTKKPISYTGWSMKNGHQRNWSYTLAGGINQKSVLPTFLLGINLNPAFCKTRFSVPTRFLLRITRVISVPNK